MNEDGLLFARQIAKAHAAVRVPELPFAADIRAREDSATHFPADGADFADDLG